MNTQNKHAPGFEVPLLLMLGVALLFLLSPHPQQGHSTFSGWWLTLGYMVVWGAGWLLSAVLNCRGCLRKRVLPVFSLAAHLTFLLGLAGLTHACEPAACLTGASLSLIAFILGYPVGSDRFGQLSHTDRLSSLSR